MNVSFKKSLAKGFRNLLLVAIGGLTGALMSPEVADGFKDAGPFGSAIVLLLGGVASALWDYGKRKLSE